MRSKHPPLELWLEWNAQLTESVTNISINWSATVMPCELMTWTCLHISASNPLPSAMGADCPDGLEQLTGRGRRATGAFT